MKKNYTTLFIAVMIIAALSLLSYTSSANAAQLVNAGVSSVAAGQTPTDTDNATGDGCLKVTPSEIAVPGTGTLTADVTISLIRADVITLPEEELNKLVISIDDTCAGNIIINKITAGGTAEKPEITASITVPAGIAGTACSIQVTDPQGIADPPLNCEGSISFVASEEPGGDCALESISPAGVTVKLKLVPRLVNVTIKGNASASFSRESTLSFDGSGITPLAVIAKDAQTLNATILVWGAEKGQ